MKKQSQVTEADQKKSRTKKQNINTVKKTFFKQYMSIEDNRNYEPGEKLTALYNRFGFFGILEGGFYSTGNNNLEICFPDNCDYTQFQEKGMTLFFWIGFSKQPNNLMRYIFKKGNLSNEMTPCIGILPNNTNLFIKLITSNQKTETMISNKKIEPGKIYSVCLTINSETEESMTEMSLYLDGILDSQISLPGIPMQNYGNFFLGKYDNSVHGFVGTISEIMFIPNILEDVEIEEINNKCLEEFVNSNGFYFNTANIFEEKLQRKVLMEKYLKHTGNSALVAENLSMTNQELKEIVKQFDEEERKYDEEEKNNTNNNLKESNTLSQIESTTMIKMKQNLEKLLTNEEDLIKTKKFYLNSKLISTVLFLANDKQDVMELQRVVDIFDVLGENMLFEVDLFFFTNLCKCLNAIIPDDKKCFSLSAFFSNLFQIHDIYFPEEKPSGYIKTNESNTIVENDVNNLKNSEIFGNNNINNLYDDALTGSIKEDFVIKSLYPGKDVKKSEEISPRMNNDLVNQEENKNKEKEINEPSSKNKTTKDLAFVTGVYTKKENENKNDDNENKQNNEEEVETNEWDPEYPDNWNEGAFELIINHCYKCEDHKTTTRHMEYQFIDKFNEISYGIKNIFPNIQIFGNYDDLEYYGSFDVYIHGIGPYFDNKGRYFIYKKNAKGRFPKINEITDKLIALSMVYGGSINMEKSQKQFLIDNSISIGKKSKFFHEHPAYYSEKAEEIKTTYYNSKSKQNSKIDINTTKFICSNWGCGKEFVQINNHPKCCIYHSGVWQFGSINGYWPECWSCCEGKWDSEGCTIGYHKGYKKDEKTFLCLNYGEINPITKRPDSACGKYFLIGNEDGCLYHKGYLKKGKFTCCGGDKNSEGCYSCKHNTAKYPDQKAKLYFYPKPVRNPGIINKINDKNEEPKQDFSIGDLICKSDYFKKIKEPYVVVKPKE